MFQNFGNLLAGRYLTNDEAIVISCFFNPLGSRYRLKVFNQFYKSIKHLNHRIVECVIGNSKPQLPQNPNIEVLYTEGLLWHKEALLNGIIAKLPKKYKYVFWVDADVLFTNQHWLVDGVKQLEKVNIIQPFEYCIHLEKDRTEPNFNVAAARVRAALRTRPKSLWCSFAANYVSTNLSNNEDYDRHGHVGFAWGARRDVLDKVPLFDKALNGGADHIMAHAAAGHIPHSCIRKGFKDDIESIEDWSYQFFSAVKGKIGYVKGDLYHLWHGDIEKRQYLKRIQDFTIRTKNISKKDKNGLYVPSQQDDLYLRNYF